METEALRELIENQQAMVIALGGGLPIGGNLYGEEPVRQRALLRGERNRELLAELGYVFYLKITAGEVYRRLKGDTTRPLLQTEDPYARITELLQQRDMWYEKNVPMRSSPLRVRTNGSLRMKLSVSWRR